MPNEHDESAGHSDSADLSNLQKLSQKEPDGTDKPDRQEDPDKPVASSLGRKINSTSGTGGGREMPLLSLAPDFNPEHHQLYLDLLERAIADESTRNIALTGSYGSGKSSVLDRLKGSDRKHKIVELSLSTLQGSTKSGNESNTSSDDDANNRIQKEIVKQLLYKLPPSKMPRTRFPRAHRPRVAAGIPGATGGIVVTGIAWFIAQITGFQSSVVEQFSGLDSFALLTWLALGAAAGSVGYSIGHRYTGRYRTSADVKTGLLTVKLEEDTSGYFDQYLDEIVYFFEVSKTNLVIIEDIDRFNDAAIFDNLRSLNLLVNNSGQIKQRIIFIYAIRDSALGELHSRPAAVSPNRNDDNSQEKLEYDRLHADTERASRAKYFDIIIPIVPFVSAGNARDLLVRVMYPYVQQKLTNENRISPGLLRLAARYIPDMRTLFSIRNEFEIHFSVLKAQANPAMPGITADIIFSLVLLRVTTPQTYEGIRWTTSPLDDLTTRWRTLVDENLVRENSLLTELMNRKASFESQASRARTATDRLMSLESDLKDLLHGQDIKSLELLAPIDANSSPSVDAWASIAKGDSLRVSLTGRYNSQTTISLSPKLLGKLIDMSVDPADWEKEDLSLLCNEISEAESRIDFLRRHEWRDLYDRMDFTTIRLESEEDENQHVSFADLVRIYAPSQLTHDLIKHGYLPRFFATYAAAFYGEVVSPAAADFIARYIETGVPSIRESLGAKDIADILREQGAETDDSAPLFDEVSIYNIDIIKYLVQERSKAAERVATLVAKRWSRVEREFTTELFNVADANISAAFAALMAPFWDEGVRFSTTDQNVPEPSRLAIVDAVLGNSSEGILRNLDDGSGRVLELNFAALTSITEPKTLEGARVVMRILVASGVRLDNLSPLNLNAVSADIETRAYVMNSKNLSVLRLNVDISLDSLRGNSETLPIYNYALDNLEDYLHALSELQDGPIAIIEERNLIDILWEVSRSKSANRLGCLIEVSSDEFEVHDLSLFPTDAWASLMQNRRVEIDFRNVQLYIEERGLDRILGLVLEESSNIEVSGEVSDADRLQMAVEIISARDSIPNPLVRVEIIDSIQPGHIPIGLIQPEDVDMVPLLLENNLLPDDASTFNLDLLWEWEDYESVLAVSEQFVQFMEPGRIRSVFIPSIIGSKVVSSRVKKRLVEELEDFFVPSNHSIATKIGDSLVPSGLPVGFAQVAVIQRAGGTDEAIVRLLASEDTHMTVAEVRVILRDMGGDYGRLSVGGQGKVRFPYSSHHVRLFALLEGVTHNGARRDASGADNVTLVANLIQARS